MILLFQLTRLKDTLAVLRQNYTESAFTFESKLKSFLRLMDDASGNFPLQNISIPHILPLLELLSRDEDSVMEMTVWEERDSDLGLDIILAHLDTARMVTEQCGVYRIKAESVIEGVEFSRDLLEVMRTELHLRLLWGVKGAGVNPRDRYSKFTQILSALSERAEPTHDHGTAL